MRLNQQGQNLRCRERRERPIYIYNIIYGEGERETRTKRERYGEGGREKRGMERYYGVQVQYHLKLMDKIMIP